MRSFPTPKIAKNKVQETLHFRYLKFLLIGGIFTLSLGEMIHFGLRICFQMGWFACQTRVPWILKNSPSKSPGLSSMRDRHLEHMTCDVFLGKSPFLLGVRIFVDRCFSFQAYCCCWIYPYQPRMLPRSLKHVNHVIMVVTSQHPGWRGEPNQHNWKSSSYQTLDIQWEIFGHFKTSISSCRVFI